MTRKEGGFPTRILADLQEGYCNLRCPMCAAHGGPDRERLAAVRGHMALGDACRLYDEMRGEEVLFQPTLWSEPLLCVGFPLHISALKERGIRVALNTNGLLLDEEMARFLVHARVDQVFVSIDASTPETLEKIRGIRDLERIHAAVFRLLEARGAGLLPRVGVSFTAHEENRAEFEGFKDFWLEHVDAVRFGEVYERGKWQKNLKTPEPRLPCPAIHSSLAVHHDGDVSICCLDVFKATNMGNVFKDGIRGVWNGPAFQEVRRLHEEGRYDRLPFCQDCNVWANFSFSEERSGDLLIRRSGGITYYNRMDRLGRGAAKPSQDAGQAP